MKTQDGEPMYCAQQIAIPSELPDILKAFTKAIIRANPADVLRWSAEYFNRESGSKLTLPEDPEGFVPGSDLPGLSEGGDAAKPTSIEAIAALHKALSQKKESVIPMADVLKLASAAEITSDFCAPLFAVGEWSHDTGVDWLNFLALAVGTLSSNLCKTMTALCDVSGKTIDKTSFVKAYKFLAQIESADVGAAVEKINAEAGGCEAWCGLIA